jgi:hypothetical protein
MILDDTDMILDSQVFARTLEEEEAKKKKKSEKKKDASKKKKVINKVRFDDT